MKKILILLAIICLSANVMAKRISLTTNAQAQKIVMSQDFVKEQFSQIQKLAEESGENVKLLLTTSVEDGIREDLEIDETYNSGMSHKFIFENADSSLTCKFKIYVIYQHTNPLSLNTKFSKVKSEAECYSYSDDY